MINCGICGEQFETQNGLWSHQKAHSPTKHRLGYELGAGGVQRERYEKRLLEYEENPKRCTHCDKILPYEGRKKKFCNASCAATHNNKLRDYTTFKPGPKKNTLVKEKHGRIKYTSVKQCVVCNTYHPHKSKTCSRECYLSLLSTLGKQCQSRFPRRSKQEIELFELCKHVFVRVTHNEPLVNGWDADIIIHDTKTAILWNGPWHYKHMPGLKHSLSQVQNRDKIKIKELQTNGWTVLVFEDRYYTPLEAFAQII